MFVCSVKATKKALVIFIFTVLSAICVLCCSAIIKNSTPVTNAKCKYGEYYLLADNAEHRLSFFGQFGYKTSDEPVYCKDVIIPEEFSDVYEAYNQIQLEQGLNLEKYKGKACKLFTYRILNYKSDFNPVINILVYDGYVIGGDVSSSMLNGFMHGFYKD